MEKDEIERREFIRATGYRLAASGLFTDWEGIKRALCARFGAQEVLFMFASPFCRLDIDERCREARGMARHIAKGDGQTWRVETAVNPSADINSTGHFREGRTNGPALEREIGALMANGGEWRAKDIAERFDASTRCVAVAFEKMAARGEVHVKRYATRAGRGAPARIFAYGPGPENAAHMNRMTIEERILNLMVDGSGWMAKQLALTLGMGRTGIGRALLKLEQDGRVRVTRRNPTKTGRGMSARVFELCAALQGEAQASTETVASWSESDPAVAAAFEASFGQSAIGDRSLLWFW